MTDRQGHCHPARPKLDELPHDCFEELTIFTILERREYSQSNLRPRPEAKKPASKDSTDSLFLRVNKPRATTVKVLEAGIVRYLDYKIITAERADDPFGWLRGNKYG